MAPLDGVYGVLFSLNESPSEKEGKCRGETPNPRLHHASMKVPPKRKGNPRVRRQPPSYPSGLNESPSEKEGKSARLFTRGESGLSLNESPSEKEGKFGAPKRQVGGAESLNESPSEKEGKSPLMVSQKGF